MLQYSGIVGRQFVRAPDFSVLGEEGTHPRRLLVGGAAALVVFAIGHLLGKGVQPALSSGEDYLPGVRAGIEADSDSPNEPLRQD